MTAQPMAGPETQRILKRRIKLDPCYNINYLQIPKTGAEKVAVNAIRGHP